MLSARGVCQEEVFAQSCSHGSLLALEMRKAPPPWEPGAVLLGCSPWQDGCARHSASQCPARVLL